MLVDPRAFQTHSENELFVPGLIYTYLLEKFKFFVQKSFAQLDIVQEKDNLRFTAEYCTIQF